MTVNVGPVLRQVLGEARGNEMLTWAHWRRGTLPFLTWRSKCKAGQVGRERGRQCESAKRRSKRLESERMWNWEGKECEGKEGVDWTVGRKDMSVETR